MFATSALGVPGVCLYEWSSGTLTPQATLDHWGDSGATDVAINCNNQVVATASEIGEIVLSLPETCSPGQEGKSLFSFMPMEVISFQVKVVLPVFFGGETEPRVLGSGWVGMSLECHGLFHLSPCSSFAGELPYVTLRTAKCAACVLTRLAATLLAAGTSSMSIFGTSRRRRRYFSTHRCSLAIA